MSKPSLKTIIKSKRSKKEILSESINTETESSEVKDDTSSVASENTTELETQTEDIRTKNKVISELVYPCRDQVLKERVELLPNQFNNNIIMNLKYNLTKKVEHKCNEFGYIVKVYKLLDYSSGIIDFENFTGSAVYNIEYLAKLCVVTPNILIIVRLTKKVADILQATFGNMIKIIIRINKDDINTNNFIIDNLYNINHLVTKKQVNINDNIKVRIKAIKFFKNNIEILALGELVDIATPDEVKKYGYEGTESINISKKKEKETNIFFNEDNEIEEENINKSI